MSEQEKVEIQIHESKSMANRLLILSSFALSKEGDGQVDGLPENLPNFATGAKDVVELRRCLSEFLAGQTEFVLSDGGTTFRFLLGRISRRPGKYRISASQRLLSRPHEPLLQGLRQLGVEVQLHEDHVLLESDGWQKPFSPIVVNCANSTQYASALLLSSKNLNFEVSWDWQNLQRSLPYWQMSQALFASEDVPLCEPDLSSAFSVAAASVPARGVSLVSFPKQSLQADFLFVEILRKMGVSMEWVSPAEDASHGSLSISSTRPGVLKAVDVDLEQAPDLLPVLAALCFFARGESVLRGVEHARYKESDRVAKSMELLSLAGAEVREESGTLFIQGPFFQAQSPESLPSFDFDPDEDHRLAMAAAVLRQGGVNVRLTHPEVVEKSFPEFWQVMEKISAS